MLIYVYFSGSDPSLRGSTSSQHLFITCSTPFCVHMHVQNHLGFLRGKSLEWHLDEGQEKQFIFLAAKHSSSFGFVS